MLLERGGSSFCNHLFAPAQCVLPNKHYCDTSNNSDLMTFKVRRVTSGLLPQQHFLKKKPTYYQNATRLPDKLTYDQREVQPSDIIGGHSLISDLLNRELRQNGLKYKGLLPSDAEELNPLKSKPVKTDAKRVEPMDQSTEKLNSIQMGIIDNEEAKIIRQSKIITEENVFSPQSTAGRRFVQNRVSQPTDLEDLEFDPSDRDLPEKMSLKVSALRNDEFIHEESLSRSVPKLIPPQPPSTKRNEPQFLVNTPRRSSPLRNILLQDSAKTSTEDAVRNISESSVIRPKTTKEIFDQINSSMERFKYSDYGGYGHNLESLSDESDDEILRSLDLILPARKVKEADIVGSFDDAEKKATQTFIPRTLENKVLALGSPGQNRSHHSRPKYNRKVSRDLKLRNQRSLKIYNAWTADKWARLEALVALSVPNSVIINNQAVQTKLGCANKEELAQRIKFLVKQLKKN